MKTLDLLVSDETLRDGEQQVGLFFEDKAALARLIAATGVHQIALMPAVHECEAQLVRRLTGSGLRRQVAASTLMRRSAIDDSQGCGAEQIILFHAVSDRLLFLRDGAIAADVAMRGKTIDDGISAAVIARCRRTMLANALEHVQYAAAQGLQVCFAAEDASRADFYFLVDCINTLGPYLDQFLLCDTVGVLTPEKTAVWIYDLLACTDGVPLSVHFHNDRGLALENTIQAVRAGALGISGTMGGIGERAGNAPLDEVLMGLRVRFGYEVPGIDYDAISRVVAYLHERGHRPHPPYSLEAQRQESGIHVSSLLRDPKSYMAFPYGQPDIWFGKGSGAGNFRYLFERYLQQPLAQSQYEMLRDAVKAIALREKRAFSADEVLRLIDKHDLLKQVGYESKSPVSVE